MLAVAGFLVWVVLGHEKPVARLEELRQDCQWSKVTTTSNYSRGVICEAAAEVRLRDPGQVPRVYCREHGVARLGELKKEQ